MKKVIVLMTAILFLLGISVVSFAVDTARAEGPAEWAAKKAAKKIEDKVLAKKKADEAFAAKQEMEKAEKDAWIKAKIAKGESPHMTAAEIKRRKINRQWIVY